jgi:ATP-binding cassette subfamily B protein
MEQQNRTKPQMRHGPGGRIMGNGEKAKNLKKGMLQLGQTLKPFRWLILTALAFAIASTTLNIVSPTIVKKLGEVITSALLIQIPIDMSKIAYYGIILICVYVVSAILNYLQGFIMAKVTADVTKRFRTQISQKINRLPLKYFDDNSIGDILSRVTNDVDTLGQSLSNSLSSVISSVTMMIGALIMMFVNSWLMTLVTLAIMPLSFVLVLVIVKISQKHFLKQQQYLGDLNGQIEEIYSAHNVVSVFSGEKKAQEKFDATNEKFFKSSFKANFLSGFMQPVMNFIVNLSYVVIAILGGYIAIKNGDPVFVVTIVTFVTYMRIFNNQISNVASISSTLQSTIAASERIFEFLEEPEQAKEQKSRQLKTVKGNVEFKNVCFGYNPDKVIIHNFNAKIKAGQKVAIVGPTGAGKTTLVNLLMRFYELNSGDILIDGVSIKDMPREEVRSYFGMVLQDTWLFEGTIRENISYGTVGLTNEQIENACSFAHIDHFIRSLPNGYDMVIDEKANISQGQRQLLTIARVMVNNSPMLILDEATSSVDTRTEELIQKAMDKLAEGRTSFVIAHRLSTIKNADIILVLKDGDIIESGNHEELLAQGGFYADLYNSQFDKN